MRLLKNIIKSTMRLVLLPWRASYIRRNGQLLAQQRLELPNDAFLGLVSEKLAEGHTATIWVKGFSMRPFIEFGRDKVKLASAPRYNVRDAVLAQIAPGHYVLHRIIGIEGEKVTLQGDGNLRGTEECRMKDICGVVVEYIRPSRTIPATDRKLCRRIELWYHLRPLRRVLLLIYNSLH